MLGLLRVGLGEDTRLPGSLPDPAHLCSLTGGKGPSLGCLLFYPSLVWKLWKACPPSLFYFGTNLPLPIGLREFIKEGSGEAIFLGRSLRKGRQDWNLAGGRGSHRSQDTVTKRGLLRLLGREETKSLGLFA